MKNKTLRMISKILIALSFGGLIFCIIASIIDNVKLPYIIVGIAFIFIIVDEIVKIRFLYWQHKHDENKLCRQWERKDK